MQSKTPALPPGFKFIEKLSKGWTSEIFLVERGKKRFVLKLQRKEKCNRPRMVEREAENLELANTIGIGPKLVDSDTNERWVLMEYVKGPLFCNWLFEKNPSRKELEKFLEELFRQAKALDEIGLDHGQLAGKGKNIIVRNNLPVLIDFEKASMARKPHNETQLESFIYRSVHSSVVKKIKEIVGSG